MCGEEHAEIEVKEIVQEIRRRAESETNTAPSRIVDTVIENEKILVRLPGRQNLFRRINRVQNKQRPKNPQSLNEVCLFLSKPIFFHTFLSTAGRNCPSL